MTEPSVTRSWIRVLRAAVGVLCVTVVAFSSVGVLESLGRPSLLRTDEVTELASRVGVPVQVLIVAGLLIPLATAAVTGGLVFIRRPRDPLAMVFALMLVTLSCYTSRGLIALSELVPAIESVGEVNVVVAFSSFVYFLLVFPDHRFANRAEGVFWFLATVFLASRPDFAQTLAERRLEAGTSTLDRFYLAGFVILFAVLSVTLVVRFRRTTGQARQQMKWVLLPMAAVGAYVTLVILLPSLFFELSPMLFAVGLVGAIPISVAFPICIARGVLKYRLYDIDVVINRALVYGSLTAVLGVSYGGLVFGLQAVVAPLAADSDLAIAASTLAVAALFRPVRGRIQDFIDRRFYRRKVDAQTTLETFSAELRDEVDLAALSLRLKAVVADTMQPSHVSLWLRKASS